MKRKDLLGTKIHVPTENINKEIQEALFKLDIDWSNKNKKARYIKQPYLLIDGDGCLTYMSSEQDDYFNKQDDYFNKHENEEICYRDILSNLDENEFEYEFKPGDKVKCIKTEKVFYYPNDGTTTCSFTLVIGEVYTIRSIKTYDSIKCIKLDCIISDGDYLFSAFKKVEKTELNQMYGKLSLAIEVGHKIQRELEKQLKSEEKKMEIKNCDKKNLKEAVKKVTEERMNAEVEFAVNKYRDLIDSLDSINRTIKSNEERKAEIEKDLKEFK